MQYQLDYTKSSIRRPKIAILTIYPFDRGGVLSILKVAYEFCEKYFEPRLFFLGFDHEIATSLRAFKFKSSTRYGLNKDMSYVEIGARWAFWHPGHYKFTLSSWRSELEGYDYFFVVSGNVFAAHPLALLDKKFIIWAASSYEEDRRQRKDEEFVGVRKFIDRLANPKMLAIEKDIISKANFILALSGYTKTSFNEVLGYTKFAMEVSGYPIVVAEKEPSFKDDAEPTILAVGRFDDPRKNVDMLIRVFEKIYKDLPAARLFVVGTKPKDGKIFEYSKLDCYKNIVFAGKVSNYDLDTLYRKAHLMLITSYQEGLGIVGLEALSRGVPVVATDNGGVRDFIINGKTGYVVGVNDDDQMHIRAMRILQNKKVAASMSSIGRKLIRENFSEKKFHDNLVQSFVNVYPDLREIFMKHAYLESLPPAFVVGSSSSNIRYQ